LLMPEEVKDLEANKGSRPSFVSKEFDNLMNFSTSILCQSN